MSGPQPSVGAGESRGRATLLCYLALLAIALAPVVAVNLPPLNDYPSNLARAYVLLEHANSTWLQTYYVPLLTLQPNLAMDLAVMGFAQFMPIEQAGKAFVALTIVLLSAGPVVLHRAIFGRWSLWPCAAFLFVYNRVFLWGFLGFLSTLGLMFFVFAGYVQLRERAGVLVRGLATAAGAFVIFLGHLFVLGILGLAVGGWELHRQYVRWRTGGRVSVGEFLAACLPLLVPVVPFVLASPAASAANEIEWGSLFQRLEAAYYVMGNYSLRFDLLCLGLLAALAAWLLVRRHLRVHGAIAVVLGLLIAAQLAMPDLLFSSWYADRRLPLAIVLMAIAGSDWSARASPRLRQAVLAGLAVMFLARMGVVGTVWMEAHRVYASWLAAIDRLPQGVRLLHLRFDTKFLVPVPLDHVESMAVIRRQGFAPKLFAHPFNRAQAIAFTEPYAELQRLTPQPGTLALDRRLNTMMERVYYRDLFGEEYQDCYEYVIVSAPPGFAIDPGPGFTPVDRGEGFVVYTTRSRGQSFDRCWLVHRPDAKSFAPRNTYGW